MTKSPALNSKLAHFLGVNWTEFENNLIGWFLDNARLITWREAISLCYYRAAMGDPMPWEENDD